MTFLIVWLTGWVFTSVSIFVISKGPKHDGCVIWAVLVGGLFIWPVYLYIISDRHDKNSTRRSRISKTSQRRRTRASTRSKNNPTRYRLRINEGYNK